MDAWTRDLLGALAAGGVCGAVILLRWLARRWGSRLWEHPRRQEGEKELSLENSDRSSFV